MNIRYGVNHPAKCYPLNTHEEIEQAIKFFKFVPKQYMQLLSIAINNAAIDLKYPINKIEPMKGPILQYQRNLEYFKLTQDKMCYNIYPFDAVKCVFPISNYDGDNYNKSIYNTFGDVVTTMLSTPLPPRGDEIPNVVIQHETIRELLEFLLYTHKYIDIPIDDKYEPLLNIALLVDKYRCRFSEILGYQIKELSMSKSKITPSKEFINHLLIIDIDTRGIRYPLTKYISTRYLEESNEKDGIDLEEFVIESFIDDDNIDVRNIKYITPSLPDKYNTDIVSESLSMSILQKALKESILDNVYKTNDYNGDVLYLGEKNNNIHLLATKESSLCLIDVIGDNKIMVNKLSLNNKQTTKKDINHEIVKSLTEGLTIDKHGNIKVSLGVKKSYMDLYSENHMLLAESWKNKNYEGVKQNLASAFALINAIERNDKFKKGDRKLIKARAFLINDFKTYMKLLQEEFPDFDFVQYYTSRKNKYESLVIDIPKETIIGVKNLVNTLLAL